MGTVFDEWGKHDSAIECFTEALRIRRSTTRTTSASSTSLGGSGSDISVAKTLSCLASSYTAKGKDNDALSCYKEALNIFKEKLGKDH